MRLAIRFELEQAGTIPLSHQDLLTGLVYRLLGASDAEYARFLHDEGYGVGDRRQERGDRREETGERRQERGDRREETGERRQERGDRREETGDRRWPGHAR